MQALFIETYLGGAILYSESARTNIVQSTRRDMSGKTSHEACSMPILVRSMLSFQSVMDLRFFVLVAWSGEGPALTLWFSPPPWGPKAQPGFPSPPTPLGMLCVLGSGSLSVGCIRSEERRVGQAWRQRGAN